METRRYALNYSHCYTYFPAVTRSPSAVLQVTVVNEQKGFVKPKLWLPRTTSYALYFRFVVVLFKRIYFSYFYFLFYFCLFFLLRILWMIIENFVVKIDGETRWDEILQIDAIRKC